MLHGKSPLSSDFHLSCCGSVKRVAFQEAQAKASHMRMSLPATRSMKIKNNMYDLFLKKKKKTLHFERLFRINSIICLTALAPSAYHQGPCNSKRGGLCKWKISFQESGLIQYYQEQREATETGETASKALPDSQGRAAEQWSPGTGLLCWPPGLIQERGAGLPSPAF